jgi:hypothetical protein
VSENIHFDFLADKNYTSEGRRHTNEGAGFAEELQPRAALVRHSERSEESFFSKNPREIPHSANLE